MGLKYIKKITLPLEEQWRNRIRRPLHGCLVLDRTRERQETLLLLRLHQDLFHSARCNVRCVV